MPSVRCRHRDGGDLSRQLPQNRHKLVLDLTGASGYGFAEKTIKLSAAPLPFLPGSEQFLALPQHIPTNLTEIAMKIECRMIETPLYSREEVIGLLKENPKHFEGGELPVVEILLDDEVVHRTKKLAKVQRLFASLLDDLKKIKE